MTLASTKPEKQKEQGADNEDEYNVPRSFIPPDDTDATKSTIEELKQVILVEHRSDQKSHLDMIGIPPEVTTHKLILDPKFHLVKQKRRPQSEVKHAFIKDEVSKLLKIGYRLDWCMTRSSGKEVQPYEPKIEKHLGQLRKDKNLPDNTEKVGQSSTNENMTGDDDNVDLATMEAAPPERKLQGMLKKQHLEMHKLPTERAQRMAQNHPLGAYQFGNIAPDQGRPLGDYARPIDSGYAEGSIRIWDSEKGICETILNGHKGTVTALRYSKLGSLLASGSKDNDIILWDVVGETGLFRLQGHYDQVTDLVFVDSGKKLVTASKDKFLRVRDLDTQHCMQIIGSHHTEIWSIDIDPEERYLVTGFADPELRFYTIKLDLADGQLIANESETSANKDLPTENKWEILKPFGKLQRQSKDRVATVRYNKFGNLLACQVAGKMVKIFCVLDEFESKRKSKRRVSRKKQKKAAKEGLEATEKGEADIGGSNPVVTVLDIFKLHLDATPRLLGWFDTGLMQNIEQCSRRPVDEIDSRGDSHNSR
ncbi:PREDICTED: mitochondrial division protein 1-like [Nicotiana attenuata]|uniref:mitochondrial division protein 1-like n=1 Tax=Nicotiana attenuata TaxID=49451 RepID=UPI000904CC4E|nr:PREDICTED: mitochondrial division protein 1-like [Nicotiana attenuata]